ncbi:glycerol-3-phosphate 1-O-acyltransferase PlsY [Desulfogranum japonicum]|uniref:glycerol-3-phosphate 1-O-acyltransferase PlsY n=1 Tax=Desulfogranum japonicum TaxID=231447 RepID=UPI00040DA1A6|nr:glycerol-3-phosphate 1-O-acyltransferase PlsY [Desulfogranum japonicum]
MEPVHFLYIAVSYLIGAIPFGLLVSRGSGIDIRTQGSCNIGATNVARLLGKKFGVITLILDICKGFVPVFAVAQFCGEHPQAHLVTALCGGATVVGHMFSVYLGMKGGKGVATALGVFFFLSPLAVLIALVLFLAAVFFSGYVSLGSLLGSASVIMTLALLGEPGWKIWLAFFVVALIWGKHHQNIGRLLKGTEKSWQKKSN